MSELQSAANRATMLKLPKEVLSKRMSDLAKKKHSKLSKKQRVAHAKMMVDVREGRITKKLK